MDGGLHEAHWTPVCTLDDILINTGVCALIQGMQIAIFRVRLAQGGEQVFAVDNCDPQSEANVLSRGLVGSLGGRIVVASPIYKHHYDLATGECLEEPSVPIRAYAVRVENERVWVAV